MCFKLFKSKNNTRNNDELVFPYKLYRGWYFPVIQFYIAKDLESPPIAVSGLVDSGANLSIFNKETAEALGITMSKGKRRSFSGVASQSYGYRDPRDSLSTRSNFKNQRFKLLVTSLPIQFADYSHQTELIGIG